MLREKLLTHRRRSPSGLVAAAPLKRHLRPRLALAGLASGDTSDGPCRGSHAAARRPRDHCGYLRGHMIGGNLRLFMDDDARDRQLRVLPPGLTERRDQSLERRHGVRTETRSGPGPGPGPAPWVVRRLPGRGRCRCLPISRSSSRSGSPTWRLLASEGEINGSDPGGPGGGVRGHSWGGVTFVMCVVVVVVEVSAVKVWELSRRPVGGLESP